MRIRVSKIAAIATGAAFLAALEVARLDPSTAEFERNGIDHAWEISLASTLAQGQLSGRDFYFTYGPLAQLVAYVGAAWNDGAVLDGFFALQLAFRVLAILLLCLALGLVTRIGWRVVALAFLAFALLDVLHDVAAPRMLALVVCVLVAHRALDASTSMRRRMLACAAGASSFLTQLLTPEFGLVALATNVGTLGAFAAFASLRRSSAREELLLPSEYLSVAALILGVHLSGNLVLCAAYAASSGAAPLDYLRYTDELLRGYNATMGMAWQPPVWVSGAICALMAYITVFCLRALRCVRAHDGWLLLSLWCVAVAAARAMLLRSDWAHVSVAAIPAIFLLVVSSCDWIESGRRRFDWALVLVFLVATWPDVPNAARNTAALLRGDIPLAARWTELRTFRMLLDDVVPRDLVARLPDDGRALVVFPYQNDVAIALGRSLLTPTLQAFLAHTPRLQRDYVARLEAKQATTHVVYAVDDVASWRVDGVQQVTRLPAIFEYLQQSYDLPDAAPAASGYYVLRRRAEPARMRGVPLAYSTVRTGRAAVRLVLQEPAACSLLRLGVRLDYPPTAWLARPERLDVRVSYAGAEVARTGLVPVAVGETFDTYVSLMDARRFHEVFVPGAAQTKNADELRIEPMSSGVLGVEPSAGSVTHVDCVTFE